MPRFIIEGTHNGRVIHRSWHPASSTVLYAWAKKTSSITHSDGAKMAISVRDIEPEDGAKSTYGELIARCARYDVDSVDALIAAERLA